MDNKPKDPAKEWGVTGYYPKTADEFKFYLKHLIKQCNNADHTKQDHVFNGSVKPHDRETDRHGYNPGTDLEVYEAEYDWHKNPEQAKGQFKGFGGSGKTKSTAASKNDIDGNAKRLKIALQYAKEKAELRQGDEAPEGELTEKAAAIKEEDDYKGHKGPSRKYNSDQEAHFDHHFPGWRKMGVIPAAKKAGYEPDKKGGKMPAFSPVPGQEKDMQDSRLRLATKTKKLNSSEERVGKPLSEVLRWDDEIVADYHDADDIIKIEGDK